MDLLKALQEFASWPEEIQRACMYQLQHSGGQVSGPLMPAKPRVSRPHVPLNNGKAWSDDDLLLLYSPFDQHGWDRDLAPSWAKRFDRKVTAIRAQYDAKYTKFNQSEQQESPE